MSAKKATQNTQDSTAHGGCPAVPCSVLEFDLHTGTKRYEGTVKVPDYDETCTLPMIVNSLMVNLAKDCPEIHEATEMIFKCKMSKPNDRGLATAPQRSDLD